MVTTAKLLEDSLMLIWNERNADIRLEAMHKIYASDIHFFESNIAPAIVGYQAINELISNLQKEWSIEFEFELNKPSQVNHSTQIVSWNLGPKGSTPIASGMDIAITENNFIKSLYLFLDTK
jgi:hypothetical protein